MTYNVPLIFVELEEGSFHILIEIELSNGENTYWVVDTGASRSVMDVTYAHIGTLHDLDPLDEIQSAGISGEPFQIQLVDDVDLKIGECKLKNLSVALIDLSNVNQLYEKNSDYTISGLIGGDILMDHNAVIDYGNQLLVLQ